MYMYMRRHYRVIIRYILQSIKVVINALALSKFYTDINYICSINPRLVGTTCIFVWCKYSMGSFWLSVFGFLNFNFSTFDSYVQTNPMPIA